MSREQRMTALGEANERRSAKARLRRDLKSGAARVEDVLLDPPDYLAGTVLFDLLLMGRMFGNHKLKCLNQRAMAAGVNLALTVERASTRTRRWIADDLSGRHEAQLKAVDDPVWGGMSELMSRAPRPTLHARGPKRHMATARRVA